MKTVKEIKKEIIDLDVEFKDGGLHKKAILTRAGKKRTLLTKCIYYLETNPQENFVKGSLVGVEKKIKTIDDGFGDWQNSNDMSKFKNPITAYRSEMGLANLKLQQRVLKYLLKY